MSPLAEVTKDRGIGVITVDNPLVNALRPGVHESLAESIEQAVKDDAVLALVVRGA